jgi:hypothetical protein
MRKFGRIPYEEDGRVVLDQVPIALLGAELDGKAARISCMVGRTTLTADSGEPDGDRAFPSLGREYIGKAEVIKRVGRSIVAVRAATFSMNNALGYSFTIKVREQVHEVKILEQKWPALASTLCLCT